MKKRISFWYFLNQKDKALRKCDGYFTLYNKNMKTCIKSIFLKCNPNKTNWKDIYIYMPSIKWIYLKYKYN